jgi:RNA polymerase sigma-70 factor (ECF subfamily)
MDPPPSDHEHFLSLLESHKRLLLKVGWAYGSTSHDRDDLLQEIVGRLWAAFGKYDRSRKFSTWMYRVALNVAIDFRRRQRRWGRETASLDDVGEAVPAAATDEATKRQQLRELRELLEQQSDPDRALLLLYLEGHSYREIGDVLGIGESNVGTRLNRLKKSLRQSVQGSSDEEQGELRCNLKNYSSNGSGSIRSSINR